MRSENAQGDAWASGLDEVVVAATALSHVDGEAGSLVLAGRPVEDWRGCRFSSVVAELWRLAEGKEHTLDQAELENDLGRARLEAHRLAEVLESEAIRLGPYGFLLAGLSLLRAQDRLLPQVIAVGAAPVFVAAAIRLASGEALVVPDPENEPVADFLRLLRGSPAPHQDVRALGTYLATVSDHGLNASTFAARVAASTQAGVLSAAVAGAATLKGPLHGGAPGPVLDMLDEIGDLERTEAWVRAALRRGDRLMGFGHRLYRTRDPRAEIFRAEVARLDANNARLVFATQAECRIVDLLRDLKPARPLDANVEFYTAVLLEALGIPREAFAALFAMGRVAGWTAHALEQERVGRLIRPKSELAGPALAAA